MKKNTTYLILTVVLLFGLLFAQSPKTVQAEQTTISNIEVVSKTSDHDTDPPRFSTDIGCHFEGTGSKSIGIVGDDFSFHAYIYEDMSQVNSASITIKKPSGEQVINLESTDKNLREWGVELPIIESDIGMWTITKIEATDEYGNKAEKKFSNWKIL